MPCGMVRKNHPRCAGGIDEISQPRDDLTKISIPLLGELAIKLAERALPNLLVPIVGQAHP